jgi:hypothetical protein
MAASQGRVSGCQADVREMTAVPWTVMTDNA